MLEITVDPVTRSAATQFETVSTTSRAGSTACLVSPG